MDIAIAAAKLAARIARGMRRIAKILPPLSDKELTKRAKARDMRRWRAGRSQWQ